MTVDQARIESQLAKADALIRQGRLIEAAFQTTAVITLSPDMPPHELHELRVIFFMGAYTGHTRLTEDMPSTRARMDKELDDFRADPANSWAARHPPKKGRA